MLVGRIPRTAARAAAVVLLLSAGTAGCGDGGGRPPGSPRTGTGSVPAPSTAGGVDPQPSDSASASGPADTTAAGRQVAKNWTTFFDPARTTEEKARVLENGTVLKPLLTAFDNDGRGGRSSAGVKDVRFHSATRATVTYDLLLDGAPALPGAKGTAVLQDGVWKVSAQSLCALVKRSGNKAAAGC
jgi:hypothetical protein